MKLSVVVPCFNEEDNIQKLGTEFFPVMEKLLGDRLDGGQIDFIEVVFVDDGSKDNTYNALKVAFGSYDHPSIAIKFEKHDVNRGLGAAMRTGFGVVTGDIVVTTDSDGTYHFSTIPSMLEHLKGKVAIVTASPYHPKGAVVGVPGYRIFLSRGSSLLYRILLNWKVHTYTALYRAYRREVIDQISFAADDFLGGTELMVKAMLKDYQVDEFPAVLHRRMFGVSKAKLLKTIMSHLNFQARLVLHRLHIRSLFAD
ncbi:MAG TPA: glycosyltransferase family 2 protein [Anaerolineales bacterium]|nr:glycosyltransferase family 2 protein [Anaerolineales bacterium]